MDSCSRTKNFSGPIWTSSSCILTLFGLTVIVENKIDCGNVELNQAPHKPVDIRKRFKLVNEFDDGKADFGHLFLIRREETPILDISEIALIS